MNVSPTLERVAELLAGLPDEWPVQLAALDLVDGYNEHVIALHGYMNAGRVSQARGLDLVEKYRRRLHAQLLRLQRQVKGGAA